MHQKHWKISALKLRLWASWIVFECNKHVLPVSLLHLLLNYTTIWASLGRTTDRRHVLRLVVESALFRWFYLVTLDIGYMSGESYIIVLRDKLHLFIYIYIFPLVSPIA